MKYYNKYNLNYTFHTIYIITTIIHYMYKTCDRTVLSELDYNVLKYR